MKLKAFWLILSMILLNSAWANLYNCTGSSSKPMLLPAYQQAVEYSTTSPFMKPNHLDPKIHENKTPFLVYYAIDSDEAFMQYAVKFEIAKLQESCLKSPNVNFVGLLNSLYVEENKILICKDQKISNLDLSKFPQFDTALKTKRKFIKTGDHLEDDRGPMEYNNFYFTENNKPFGKYPLSSPDFLHDLIEFVSSEKTLFPSEKYMPFLNLKSHGSKWNVLAGMHKCQEKSKKLSADENIKKNLNKNEIRFLSKIKNLENIQNNLNEFDRILSKLQLGTTTGVGPESLGGNRLGDAITGLGVNQGLGIEFSFGTKHVHLNWVLGDLFDNDTDRRLGFLMLESCETNRDPELFHSYLDNVLGYYSAKDSLWYRNLNWWTLLERANGSSLELVKILKEETAKIPNIKVSTSSAGVGKIQSK